MDIIRGSTLTDAIGYAFEWQLKREYPFLEPIPKGSNLSDFRTNHFYLEAKAGCYYYGARIKPTQVDKFSRLNEPVFYAFGFHNVQGLARMKKSIAFRCVADLRFDELFLVNNSLVNLFFKMEQRFSKKRGENIDEHYCVVKPRHFRQISNNELIERNGREVRAHDFYGINSSAWYFGELRGMQILAPKSMVEVLESGFTPKKI